MPVPVPFHLSFCVADLAKTRDFYSGVLGCREGKSTLAYVDFEFYGHQLTCHLAPEKVRAASEIGLEGNHFGAIVPREEFNRLAKTAKELRVPFINDPETQHEGTAQERRKMIFTDPSGNAIEIKSYPGTSNIFG